MINDETITINEDVHYAADVEQFIKDKERKLLVTLYIAYQLGRIQAGLDKFFNDYYCNK